MLPVCRLTQRHKQASTRAAGFFAARQTQRRFLDQEWAQLQEDRQVLSLKLEAVWTLLCALLKHSQQPGCMERLRLQHLCCNSLYFVHPATYSSILQEMAGKTVACEGWLTWCVCAGAEDAGAQDRQRLLPAARQPGAPYLECPEAVQVWPPADRGRYVALLSLLRRCTRLKAPKATIGHPKAAACTCTLASKCVVAAMPLALCLTLPAVGAGQSNKDAWVGTPPPHLIVEKVLPFLIAGCVL